MIYASFLFPDWGSLNSSALAHDWTALDPAIVTGQLSGGVGQPADRGDLLGGSSGGGLLHRGDPRADSPPNWITANLEQLTSDAHSPYGHSQASLIPAFSSLGLGGAGGRGLAGGRAQLGGGWGGSAATAAPPPGFSQHRAGQLQPHYPGFGLGKASEAQKIGGKLD